MSITRTTISLDSGLLETVRRASERDHRTLGQVITEALQRHLTEVSPSTRGVVRLPTAGRGGVRPGINLDSNAELAAAMDDGEAGQWSSQM
jgi:hypothetical protein